MVAVCGCGDGVDGYGNGESGDFECADVPGAAASAGCDDANGGGVDGCGVGSAGSGF